uniref:37S ribosomal protein S25, mitochondrial n=1 Tax=Caenorhabditis tropicalis TaxID=1561998 RepID=A0A1I7V3B9_9PELO
MNGNYFVPPATLRVPVSAAVTLTTQTAGYGYRPRTAPNVLIQTISYPIPASRLYVKQTPGYLPPYKKEKWDAAVLNVAIEPLYSSPLLVWRNKNADNPTPINCLFNPIGDKNIPQPVSHVPQLLQLWRRYAKRNGLEETKNVPNDFKILYKKLKEEADDQIRKGWIEVVSSREQKEEARRKRMREEEEAQK